MAVLLGAASPALAQEANTLTAAERAAGWRLLFDGKTLKGWRGYKMDTVPGRWTVENGTIHKSRPTEDLITRDQFGDFELAIDWKIGTAGNSGIFYRATEEYDHLYWSGTEYQLLDDAAASDNKDSLHLAASAYALYAPHPRTAIHPANEWNSTRIVVKGAHVEHWLNGQKVVEYELWSPDWEARMKASKFAVWPNYARAKKGYIGIQGDHPGTLELRNIKIRELH